MKMISKICLLLIAGLLMAGCGAKVEVPPAHIGKIMTKDGYQENIVPPSKFRLAWCVVWCDNIVLLDVSDKAMEEEIAIFIPEDKLNLDLGVRVTLSLDPTETAALFDTLSPRTASGRTSIISWEQVYTTYAQQIILTEIREYMSKYSIATISSSLEKVNNDIRDILQRRIQERTPFSVRYVGITNIKYPAIITTAQENAAQRREQIQQEEAQLQISKVTLERELQETRLQRQIELEKAEIEATSQRIQRETVDPRVLALRQIENQREWIKKRNRQLPTMILGDDTNLMMPVPPRALGGN